jgi:hypothetical protein
MRKAGRLSWTLAQRNIFVSRSLSQMTDRLQEKTDTKNGSAAHHIELAGAIKASGFRRRASTYFVIVRRHRSDRRI